MTTSDIMTIKDQQRVVDLLQHYYHFVGPVPYLAKKYMDQFLADRVRLPMSYKKRWFRKNSISLLMEGTVEYNKYQEDRIYIPEAQRDYNGSEVAIELTKFFQLGGGILSITGGKHGKENHGLTNTLTFNISILVP